MTRSQLFAFVLLGLTAAACGGSTPEAAAPSSDGASSSTDAASTDVASNEPSAPAAGDGWEGESEAKSSAPAAAGAEAGTPNPDTKGEETRTLEVIQKIVKDNRKPVRACYDKARKDLPSLQGDLVIFFVLDPEGKIKKIEVNQERSTLKSPAVADCAISVIKGLSFPPSSRGMETNVNYPYNFTP